MNDLNKTIFFKTIFNLRKPILLKSIQKFQIGEEYNEEDGISIKRNSEIQSIYKRFNSLSDHVDELKRVIRFMQVNRSKISLLYNDDLFEEEYYRYHYENWVIRLVTIPDICGKIGNLVLNLGIPEKYCNGYKFQDHDKVVSTDSSNSIRQLYKCIGSLMTDRHSKIHRGELPNNPTERILFFNDTNGAGVEISETLHQFTDNQLIELNQIIEERTQKVIAIVVSFLDSITPYLHSRFENDQDSSSVSLD